MPKSWSMDRSSQPRVLPALQNTVWPGFMERLRTTSWEYSSVMKR